MISHDYLLDDVLDQLALELDIPPHKYKQAMERFDAIKRHLEAGDYPDATPPPDVYLQGSFPLGTVIRPMKGGIECGFDIDMVCEVDRDKDQDDPESLKEDVGAEVKAYAEKNGMSRPANGKRCWALEYAADSEGIGFHVDILPSLPDAAVGVTISQLNFSQGATEWQYTKTNIAITNRDEQMNPPEYDWRSSNPRGFVKWFREICNPGFLHVDHERQKSRLFETFGKRQNFPYTRAEDIPNELVRTPLQRAIQILKRHRDVRFSSNGNAKNHPISMIITTLAARLYEGRASELRTTREALRFIIETLAEHASLLDNNFAARALAHDVAQMKLIQRVGDKWYIPNPVNPHTPGDPDDKGENFADRWHENSHAKAKAFFQWVGWLRSDLDALLRSDDLEGMKGTLGDAFGEAIATRTINRLENAGAGSSAIAVRTQTTALARFNVSHRDAPQWPARAQYRVDLTAQLHRDGFRTRDIPNDGSAVPKWCSLTFRANTNAPCPFKVYWQIVNTGSAASAANDLRGEIIDAQIYRGGLTWDRERTKYRGMHWVECFIVKDGVLVARSGEFVVNIE